MIQYVAVLLLSAGSMTWQPGASDSLMPLYFLLGEWAGTGAGEPGAGSGGFTFEKELDGKLLVRRSRAEYPATKVRPAFIHTDLTVVFSTVAGLRASYFDNEGNRIQYQIEIDREPNTVTFLSEAEPDAPRFRLTYRKEAERVRVRFEIAPPGQPEAFKTYTEGVVSRSAMRGK